MLTEKAKGQSSSGDTVNVVNIVSELKQRQDKEKNMVIYGVDEKEDENEDNPDNITAGVALSRLFSGALGCEDPPEPVKSFRLGKRREAGEKPRPLKIFMQSTEDRELILKNAPELRTIEREHEFGRVYIRADLTLMQRQELQKTREQQQASAPSFTLSDGEFPALHSYYTRGRGGPRGRAFGYGRGRGSAGSTWG